MSRRGRRLPVLFVVALLGVLSVVGVGVGELLGWPAAAAYAVVLLAGLVLLARRLPAPAPPADHTGCACCDGKPFTGVEVV